MTTNILDSINLPDNVTVKATDKNIEFSIPVNLPSKIIDEIRLNKEFNNATIKSKQRANKTYIISGGNGAEIRAKVLLYVLTNITGTDKKPLFDASQLEALPFPAKYLRFLAPFPTANPTAADVNAKSEILHLDVFKNFTPTVTSVKLIDKLPLALTPEQAYVLVSLFGDYPEPDPLLDLRKDENSDKQLYVLNLPTPVNVAIRYLPDSNDSNRYEMTFADDGPITAQIVRDQITNNALPTIRRYQTVFATFNQTDPVEKHNFIEVFDMDIAGFCIIPDEEFDEEDEARTFVEVFMPMKFGNDPSQDEKLSPETFETINKKYEEYFKKIQLAVCKKCGLLYQLNSQETCYKFFHTGTRIPFESGEMEEIGMEEDEDEPVTYYNWSCCGELPKDEIPMECGKTRQGRHEVDPSKEKGSFKTELYYPFSRDLSSHEE